MTKSELFKNIQDYFLKETESIWKSFDKNMQPERIWIAEFESVPDDYYGQILDKSLLAVWMLDNNGVTEKNVLDYKRFVSVHTLFERLTFPRKENSRTLETGLAQFAKYVNQPNVYYYDYEFGGFCAAGFRVEFDDDGKVISNEQIWIS